MKLGHLIDGNRKTKYDWCKVLGDSLFEELIELQTLQPVAASLLDGFEGSLNTDHGVERVLIHASNGRAVLESIDGISFQEKVPDDLVFQSYPAKLVEIFASRAGFTPLWADSVPEHGLYLVERMIEQSRFVAAFSFDQAWLKQQAAHDRLTRVSRDAKALIVVTETNYEAATFQNRAVAVETIVFPTSLLGWSIPRECFLDHRFEVSFESITRGYAEKKLIVDGISGRVCVLGREIKLEKDSQPFRFLVGICLLSTNSPVASDQFAKAHMRLFHGDLFEIVRSVRGEVVKALKKVFEGPELEAAREVCGAGKGVRKAVTRTILADEALFIGIPA